MRGGRVSSSSQGLAHWTTAAAVKSRTLPPPPYAPDHLLQCRLHAVSLCPAGLCLGVQHCNLRLALPPQPRLVSGAPRCLGPLCVILLQEAGEAQQRLLQLQVPPLQRLLPLPEGNLLQQVRGAGARGGWRVWVAERLAGRGYSHTARDRQSKHSQHKTQLSTCLRGILLLGCLQGFIRLELLPPLLQQAGGGRHLGQHQLGGGDPAGRPSGWRMGIWGASLKRSGTPLGARHG